MSSCGCSSCNRHCGPVTKSKKTLAKDAFFYSTVLVVMYFRSIRPNVTKYVSPAFEGRFLTTLFMLSLSGFCLYYNNGGLPYPEDQSSEVYRVMEVFGRFSFFTTQTLYFQMSYALLSLFSMITLDDALYSGLHRWGVAVNGQAMCMFILFFHILLV